MMANAQPQTFLNQTALLHDSSFDPLRQEQPSNEERKQESMYEEVKEGFNEEHKGKFILRLFTEFSRLARRAWDINA